VLACLGFGIIIGGRINAFFLFLFAEYRHVPVVMGFGGIEGRKRWLEGRFYIGFFSIHC